MAVLTLTIPKRVSDNFGQPISIFYQLLAEYNQAKADTLILNLSQCHFINPFLVGGITALCFDHRNKGGKVEVIYPPEESNILQYFTLIGFPFGYEYAIAEKSILQQKLSEFNHRTYIPITLFPGLEEGNQPYLRELILSIINELLKTQLNLSNNVLSGIYYLIDELTNNIAEHSLSPKGILFAQFYPSKNFMDLCIADVGKGLYQSYHDSKKHFPASDLEALNLAISGKSTKNRAESRGFGISTSYRMLVNGLKGKFLMHSGSAFYAQTADTKIITSTPSTYQGCYIALRIPILDNSVFTIYNYVES